MTVESLLCRALQSQSQDRPLSDMPQEAWEKKVERQADEEQEPTETSALMDIWTREIAFDGDKQESHGERAA